jgi:3',5'-cyclic AMP phosphodiesterase CpdA
VIGMTVDIGQTAVSNMSVTALQAMNPDIVILPGDLPYADGWGPRWDSFGRMIERLAANIPLLTTGGNHEIQSDQAWQPYKARYPTPNNASGSRNFCYWGREVGPVHHIAICSYAGFSNTSLQVLWLEQYLRTAINRTRTPWVMAMMHVPWYSTNIGHWREGELFRLTMEPLLYQYGVDIVLAGHIHAYERTKPIYNYEENECGPYYLVIGDGGINFEYTI